jgi:hypothetical protein
VKEAHDRLEAGGEIGKLPIAPFIQFHGCDLKKTDELPKAEADACWALQDVFNKEAEQGTGSG